VCWTGLRSKLFGQSAFLRPQIMATRTLAVGEPSQSHHNYPRRKSTMLVNTCGKPCPRVINTLRMMSQTCILDDLRLPCLLRSTNILNLHVNCHQLLMGSVSVFSAYLLGKLSLSTSVAWLCWSSASKFHVFKARGIGAQQSLWLNSPRLPFQTLQNASQSLRIMS